MPFFLGERKDLERCLRVINGKYYVYVLLRPDGRPFYVGKGINKRVLEHEAEAIRGHPVGESNPFKCNVIRKIFRDGEEIKYEIDSVYEASEQLNCLMREAELIGLHKRFHEGGCLTNLAGGFGSLSGASPFSLERHATTLSGIPDDNLERAVLNNFFLSIGTVKSIPVKPLLQISKLLCTTPHPKSRKPTLRCVYALIASASAHGVVLKPGSVIPRVFRYEEVDAVIENGVARDIVKAGLATLLPDDSPVDEAFIIDEQQVRLIKELYGEEKLKARGVL